MLLSKEEQDIIARYSGAANQGGSLVNLTDFEKYDLKFDGYFSQSKFMIQGKGQVQSNGKIESGFAGVGYFDLAYSGVNSL